MNNTFRLSAALIGAGVSMYFHNLAIPFIIFVVCMIADWVTGVLQAYINKDLSSQKGVNGILKKVAYMFVVGVAMVLDYLVISFAGQLGVQLNTEMCFSLLAIIWFIVNECISILENVSRCGANFPKWMTKLLEKLRIVTEEKAGEENEDN